MIEELAEKNTEEFAKIYALHLLIIKWFKTKDEKITEEVKDLIKNENK